MARKRPYHHPDLRTALLEKAAALIREGGVEVFSLRQLAASVGVSHAAPYRHFPSKEALLATLLVDGHRRLRATLLEAGRSTPGDAADRLAALGRAYLAFAAEHPAYLRVMFSREGMRAVTSAGPKPDPALLQELDSFGVLEAAVRDCQREGSIDPQPDAGAYAIAVWAEVHGLALLRGEGLIAEMVGHRGLTEAQAMRAILDVVAARKVSPRREAPAAHD